MLRFLRELLFGEAESVRPTMTASEYKTKREALDRDIADFLKRVGNKGFHRLSLDERYEYEHIRMREGEL